MSNIGYTFNTRSSLRPATVGVQPLTTLPEVVVGPQITGDTRWVSGGSTVNNFTTGETGAPCRYVLWYAPIGLGAGDLTDDMIFRSTEVAPDDFHQIGMFPVCRGFQVWGMAEANGRLNLAVFTEDVE